jgi:EF-P beta-lysylation protein EpmB
MKSQTTWSRELAEAVRDVESLCSLLELNDVQTREFCEASRNFPVLVPRSFLDRMPRGNPRDPLLLQVVPRQSEFVEIPGFGSDPVGEEDARIAPGLLQKYAGRALLVTTSSCAVHCRYCFRREYPYHAEPRTLDEFEPALEAIRADESLNEILLSGGDPLMLTDQRLAELIARLRAIPHVRRIRLHTRLPIVLPSRVTPALLELLADSRTKSIVVVHANHPNEIAGDCADALRLLVESGLMVLNQSVLLRAINDNADALANLSNRLIDLGILPYYLHQLDRVKGAAHFEVPPERGYELMVELRKRLPGYAVPKYVREVAGELFKVPLEKSGERKAESGSKQG